ncbi:hypothetical protein ACDF64_03620 [Agromyces sp. MMS24-JH15]|uniref:hypothetical protein n=1 Tax=Agromyces sp. MMS24-JH15 TaxID=3243765 RepID=UPI003748CD9F
MTERDTRAEFLDSIAAEFLHLRPTGRRLVAVEGEDAAVAARLADDLAVALGRRGQHAVRLSIGDVDEAALRASVVDPFRAQSLAVADGSDTVLVVDGRRLHDLSVVGVWHFSVWTLQGDALPHTGATVMVDATDESAPTRYLLDYCAVPRSVGDLR